MNKSKVALLALIALILGVVYAAYVNYYFFVATPTEQDAAEAISEIIAGALVLPHIVVTCTAVLMNALGFFMYHRGFILTGAILYIVAIALMPIYFMFTLLQGTLLFIAFAKMKKKE